MASDPVYFQWPDYVVLAIVLLMSAAIGFYYAFTGGRQKTTREYLFADKNIHWIPVSCSLLASYISSLSIVSLPGEIYSFGTIFLVHVFFWPIGMLIASKLYLPVFHNLELVSVYRYLDLRFGKVTKLAVTWSSMVTSMLFSGMVIYGPSLSISAVTGINLWVAVALITGVALLYTIMGGMKAVLWTDTLQLIIMFVGIIGVFIAGVVHGGGPAEIYRVAKLSGRLDVLEPHKLFDFDPRARHTLWNQAVTGVITAIIIFGITQVSVQRALSLKSSSQIIRTYSVTAFLLAFFTLICGLMGLVIFAFNKHCDPIKNGEIFSKDQYYPLYVMKLLGQLPGLPGFVLSAIFSGSLSTISSIVNAMATVLMSDIVKPMRPQMTDTQATITTKLLSVLIGIFSVIFVLFAKNFGHGLISMLITVAGVFGGPSFAVFSTGLFLPFVNRRGILIGFFVGAAYAGWTGIGGLIHKPYVYTYPVTTEGCNVTDISLLANISSPVYDPSTWNPQGHYRKGIEAIYDISYLWAKLGGIILTTLVAIIISLVMGRKEKELVNYRLISPYVANSKHLPQSWRDYIDYSEDDSIMAHIDIDTYKEAEEEEIEEGKINEGISLDEMEKVS